MKLSRVHLALVLGLAATLVLIHFAPDEEGGLASAKSQSSAPSSANRTRDLCMASDLSAQRVHACREARI